MFPDKNRPPDELIRAELFSIERLEQHAESLAAAQQIGRKSSGGRALLNRVKNNGRILRKSYRSIADSIRDKRAITPAAEWLVDNYHVVEEQIREIIDDLPPGFYRLLPKLTDGHLAGYPRVYGLIWAFVAHTDSRLDPDWLRRFVRAYQRSGALDIGEGWALAISMRIILVENLRRLAERLMYGKTGREEADAVADALLGLKGKIPADAAVLLKPFEAVPLERAFAVQLVQRLRDQGSAMTEALTWLDGRLAAQNTSAEEIVRLEHQDQSAMNTTVRNVITSMRLISTLDWADFFESVSIVDDMLRAESDFSAMDFSTRDLYRHAIEELSRGSRISEVDVARRAIQAAKNERETKQNELSVERERRSDPGYFLISKGRPRFEKELRFRVPLKRRLLRAYTHWATPAYLGSITATALALLAIPLFHSYERGMSGFWLAALGALAFVPASDLALAIVNRVVTESLGPKPLPKLDFIAGIPDSFRTLVAMPTLLTSRQSIEENLEHLEIHYLSNSEGHLQFALLTDWMDAPQEHRPDDEMLLLSAREGVDKLNERYGPGADGGVRFFLLHRRRLWNEREGVWMGWERKRGKLHELNRLLRGDSNTSFIWDASGLKAAPSGVRYVITLDADTRMPRGAAYRLVGAMAHPLNRPHFGEKQGRVVEGYGIMQPRITPSLPTTGAGSPFQWIFSGPAGVDPYAFAVSDVYQDLFKEGSYIGKGIYDVDAFESALAGRAPENAMLSHDLFEGLYARTALVTEIELFEEFPSHYEAAVSRQHRWVRGDWQLLPWIFGAQRPRLPWIGRWKMIDNLRRSLSAPAILAGLLCAWTRQGAFADIWVGFILATLALPPLIPVLLGLLPQRREISLTNYFRGLSVDLRLALWHAALAIAFLPHQAWILSDAVLRTLYRLLISRRHLLEWTSAAQVKNLFDYKLSAFYRRMSSAPVLAFAAAGIALSYGTPGQWWMWAPFCVVWILSPLLAQRISLPLPSDVTRPLTPKDRRWFRRIARQTWRFFETFVDAQTHFLPPDNFQEIPKPVVAPRTSPTNIGLYMLSVAAARDFGWIGLVEALDRLEATLSTVKNMQKHQGHLFNWYDVADLRPLDPLYVSTVDSGNFAGHLWAIASACRQWARSPLLRADIVNGFEDALWLVKEAAGAVVDDRRTETVTGIQLQEDVALFENSLRKIPSLPAEWGPYLEELADRAATLVDIATALGSRQSSVSNEEILKWSELLSRQIASHARDAAQRAPLSEISPAVSRRLLDLADLCEVLVEEMQFGFLFDPTKKIFSIGYQVGERKLDPSYYDLLASEARLASFVAIAKGDVPALHWFRLSRLLRPLERGLALLSWSGSMFEYLMPSLVMRSPQRSLIDQTNRRVVRRQIAYGRERGVPWGVSECAYNAQNLEFTYQYSNFGVPGLGLKRGLADDLVIAPYATALASMTDPLAAANNFRELANVGASGRFGFYEALDYTPTRLPENLKVAVVQAFMAHHQGMSLVALANVLYDGAMQKRFHSAPMVQATELLLQERTPRDVPVTRPKTQEIEGEIRRTAPLVLRRFHSPHDVLPRTHLLSNGHYSVMITASGSGYSKIGNMAVTRWREDPTRDQWGSYIFMRDVRTGDVWSAGYQPSGVAADKYEVDFSEDRAEIARRDGSITSTLEVVVSPQDDAEIRRVTLKNEGAAVREIDVTSYAEIVLATPAADQAHPAFSNLFVQTEYVPEVNGLICARRRRSPEDPVTWLGHVVVVEGTTVGDVEFESDRARFLGRGRGIRTPMCVIDGKPLSNTAGAVLDPIVSLRRRVRIEPGETVRVAFSTLVAASRDEAMGLADKYHDPAMFERTVTLAWTQAQVQQNYLGIEPSEAHLFQDLASRLIYTQAGLRPSSDILKRNTKGASGLWAYGISGDLPIILVRIDETDDRGIVRELLRAHEYWRMKNLAVDLVILNERTPSYAQDLQGALENLVRTTQATLHQDARGAKGGIFILRLDQLSNEDRLLFRAAARVTLLSRHGTLAQQMERLEGIPDAPAAPPLRRQLHALSPPAPSFEKLNLQFFNGLGGFSTDGMEYVTALGAGQWTPAPWINVVSNPQFGFSASEAGSGSTWSVNSRENQITPWSNDPVSDPSGEVFYIRDEETGDLWTPTVLPIREETSPYICRHGQGYSRFEHSSHGILAELTQFVPVGDPVKISRLTLTNKSGRMRRLSVTAYVEWVLGTSRAASAPYLITEIDEKTGAMLARNPWNNEFSARVAFSDLSGSQKSWTADRTEFLGRNGTLEHPYALESGQGLSGRIGAGLDSCAALQTEIELRPGASADVVFFLGEAAGREEAVNAIGRLRSADLSEYLAEVRKQWDDILGAVQVHTPDKAMDLLLNRWLLYQTLSCRLWSRAGFYQAGGAYGFRDQLQDVMALIVTRRDLAREHILRAAGRQFAEGDVQHWWHPPTGRGVRTKISDDLLWLPYVVSHYIEVTGDADILDEPIPFLEGQPIPAGREDIYFQPAVSNETATLFEHCARALDRSLAVGSHGLPLMGSGDWNDGMNRVGHEGKGESVWLAWFLHTTLWEFAKTAQKRGDLQRAEKWRLHVGELKTAVERNGWDGEWYARAYFDDGKPLGSTVNTECRIDSIAQSWGVLSGAADPARAARAMAAVNDYLVRRKEGLILIFTPPFNQTNPNPGYIQGYLPGVRENGGQYTHAAIWSVLAFAALGDGDKAGELFSLLNPINHGKTRTDIHRYKVEPYVMAGDVYSEPPHVGRGGWTWYTGAAGWTYRAGIEWILGFRLRENKLMMDPCIPRAWPGFQLSFRYHGAKYEVTVENPNNVSRGVKSAELDGKPVRSADGILLSGERGVHKIRIVLG